jgi:hypothetical protein
MTPGELIHNRLDRRALIRREFYMLSKNRRPSQETLDGLSLVVGTRFS